MYKLLTPVRTNVVSSAFVIRFYSSSFKPKHKSAKMPLDPKHIAEAQKQRLKLKQKIIKTSPGIVNLQIVGSGAPGTPASVYLFSDQTRYLFNCGEGTQRLAYEHKTKLSCLENIFMTRTCWERIGGLPGICLTMQDVGVPNVTLHGPPGLDELFKAMRRFVILKDMKVEAAECKAEDVFDDHVMSLKYVAINREPESVSNSEEESQVEDTTVDDTDYYAYEKRNKPTPRPKLMMTQQDWTKRHEESVMAYICKLKLRFGQLSLEKCVDRGVTPGPLLGQLKNGKDVTLPNGTVVKSSDVRGPDDPGPVFIFIDIPSEEYFRDLDDKNEAFAPYQSTATEESNQAMYVLHFSPLEVMQKPEYRKFMDRFSASTRHIALNEINSFSGYIASHRIQYHLNQLDSDIFPLLKEANNDYDNTNAAMQDVDIVKNSSLSYLHVRPRKGIDRTQEAKLNPSEYLQELEVLPEFKLALDQLHQKMAQRQPQQEPVARSEKYPRVVFLGTGSSIPNKTRNVSAILVHTGPSSSILLDCGEGTAGQIIRFYGQERAKDVFRTIKAIYISHLHADHHLGLFGLLHTKRKLLGSDNEKILLVAPEQISYWLRLYDCRFEPIHKDYVLVKNADLVDEPLSNGRAADLGLTEIATCRVRHCPHSFGVALSMNRNGETDEPVKITYSGDTMPCQNLIDLGRDSTILIHEATMEDELETEARVKMHSTLSQAIEQGKKMNAKYTLLTHFSQRYAKIPRIESELETNLGIAFDNMEVTLDDLPQLNLFYPALKAMFISHFEEMEQKAIKRGNKRMRLEGGSGNNSKEPSPTR